jgi:hypothetical protein
LGCQTVCLHGWKKQTQRAKHNHPCHGPRSFNVINHIVATLIGHSIRGEIFAASGRCNLGQSRPQDQCRRFENGLSNEDFLLKMYETLGDDKVGGWL